MATAQDETTHLIREDDRDPDGSGGFVFGFRLGFLVDALQNPDYLGTTDREKVEEHWARWIAFVNSLWKAGDNLTYCLRSAFIPDAGKVDVTVFGKYRPAGRGNLRLDSESRSLLGTLTRDLEFMLRLTGYDPKPMLASEILRLRKGMDTLAAQGGMTAYRIQQAEYVLPVRKSGGPGASAIPSDFVLSDQSGDYQTVYFSEPMPGPVHPFDAPYRCLAGQSSRVEFWSLIRGTCLEDRELQSFAGMARQSATLSHESSMGVTIQGAQVGASQTLQDPVLGLIGNKCEQSINRLLHRPFVCSSFVLSKSRAAAWQVARALTSTISNEWDGSAQGSAYPVTSEIMDPIIATSICRDFNLDWIYDEQVGHVASSVTARRARYLTDGMGAASVFRLPAAARSGLPGITVKQQPPGFHPGPLKLSGRPSVQLGLLDDGTPFEVPLQEFNKHVLITGFTGSGKTKTVLTILHQMWCDHGIPFLVLESAKSEYRGLTRVPSYTARSPNPRAYTVGNESCSPIRLNPFQLLEGVRVEAHVSRLQTCFEGSLPPIGPISSVVIESLVNVYRNCGWLLTDSFSGSDGRPFPTMAGFVDEVGRTLERRAYVGEVASNLRAAIIGRLLPLTIGAKGLLFSQGCSSPSVADVMSGPVILEMNDLNLDDKALFTMFLLVFLREYREQQRAVGSGLRHVTVVEEAHNVLEDVESAGSGEGAGSDVRYKTVQAFCGLLTEVRSLGEGIIIADQSPQKLARDAIRNTNVQIAHQLRDSDDREAIARAMIMDDLQQKFLAKLRPGHAAIFVTGLEKATIVLVDEYSGQPIAGRTTRGRNYADSVEDAELAAYMESADPELSSRRRRDWPYPGCQLCRDRKLCSHRAFGFVKSRSDSDLMRPFRQKSESGSSVAPAELFEAVRDSTSRAGNTQREARWCTFLHALHYALRGELSEIDVSISIDPVALRRSFDRSETAGSA